MAPLASRDPREPRRTPLAPFEPDYTPGAIDAEGERRPITVLFADLAGYTHLSQQLDPEAVHALLERYFGCVDAIVTRWGGTIDKHIGDAIMALFGTPAAHADDPMRAVRTAAEIQAATPGLAAELGRPLAVHIGIAAGEVMASGLGSREHRAYTVIGRSVNLAARLLDVAQAGETVVDEAVHAQTRRHARYVVLEEVRAKGIDAPLRAYRLLGIASGGDEYDHAFVGREVELGQLSATLDAAVRCGSGGTVLVRGEAGIGKSRLAWEMRRLAAQRGFACHTGRVLDFGMAQGRDPIREVAAEVLGLAPGAGEAEKLTTLGQAGCDGEHEPFLRDLLDLPQTARARGVYEAMDSGTRQRGRTSALCRVLKAAAERSPLLVTVEDIHWADPVTLECLAAIARASVSMPVVLVLTSRLEGDPLDAAWRSQVQGTPLLTVDLGPLAAKDALALAGNLLTTSAAVARQCIERAAGNPLFLEQLLHAANENNEGLPASLHSLVLSRVDRLAERDRTALRAAAVIGQRFPLDLLRHLARMPDYECEALVAHFLVRPDGDDWLFAHALIRDGVYASLTLARRAELHRAAAAWFADRDPPLRAEHLDRAAAPEAAAAYLAAARTQAAALRSERALALAERGAALAREPRDVVALQLLRSELLREMGEGKRATEAAHLALAAAQDAGDRCRSLLAAAAGMRMIAEIETALQSLADAEPIAVRNGSTRELAELHYLRGNLRFTQGRIAECRAEHEAAFQCAQVLGDPEWQARALSGLADADYAEARMRVAAERFARCVALCDANGLKRIALANRAMVANCLIYLLDFDGARREITAALQEAREVGNRHSEMFALECLGLMLTWCARYDEASGPLAESLALAESIGARRYQAVIWTCLAEGWIGRGDRAEATCAADRALELARETGMAFCGPMALVLKARLAESGEAAAGFRAEAETVLASGCLSHCHIAYHRGAIDDALARDDWKRVEHHATALERFTEPEPLPYTGLIVARGRLLAALAHSPDDARLNAERADLARQFARVDWRVHWP